jgi:hypothetical protein
MFSNIEIEKMHSVPHEQHPTTEPPNKIIETKENFFQGMVTSVSLIFIEGYCWFIATKQKVLQSKKGVEQIIHIVISELPLLHTTLINYRDFNNPQNGHVCLVIEEKAK